jgi:hypothetical protein
MPAWLLVLGFATSLLIACSRPTTPALGGLEGRYEGTLTMTYGSKSKTLGISMIFEANGAVTAHSELDEPQHYYYRLRDDHTAIDLYDEHKVLYGHVQLTQLLADRIAGVLKADNGTRDLGTTDTLDIKRVLPIPASSR